MVATTDSGKPLDMQIHHGGVKKATQQNIIDKVKSHPTNWKEDNPSLAKGQTLRPVWFNPIAAL